MTLSTPERVELDRDRGSRTPRVLLTGASGFLGYHIARYLATVGIDVIVGVRRAVPIGLYCTSFDLTDIQSIESALVAERPTHIVNCAAFGVDQNLQSSADAFAVNIQGCRDLMRIASRVGVSRFVQIGSCSEYASNEYPIPETAPQRPHNLYALSKSAATMMALELGPSLGLSTVIVRPFGMWGPREPAFRLFPQIIAACRAKEPLALTPCDVFRDYSFVVDAAMWIGRITLDAAVNPGTIVNIGSGQAVLLRDLVLSVATHLGGAGLMQFGKRPHRPNEPRSHVADVTRLEALIGPLRHTRLEDGLRQMIGSDAA